MCTLIVRSSRRVDRRSRVLRRPCDAFYHVLVFPELDLTIPNDFALRMNAWITFKRTRSKLHYLSLLCRNVPYSNSLIVRAAGDEFAAWADSRHSHPFPMSRKRLHTVARRHFPDLDGFIPGGAHHEVTLRHKRDRVDIVVVTVHGLDASE